ncbi:Ubiquinone biosynthesis monooxygenase COQ6, mitochondrial [Lachnellula hyalina]|uniref:Ubiquinone biosynthesis monooxygenase COQ6, mitochondrial n=1 Tax=Lachnellula hyalina TaxID=1316788 RepID=A0A8H8R5I3_9HELO|nr:Ubiquinone biosynthesis monooxygenase COQ6, mitochondrial [Lachnellula hyalina]TVY28100.1 Ubiquinone biosynthesis monooxygenase COQ6, mitochondrial [Lachnellula hyalina]
MKPFFSTLRARQLNGYVCQTCTRQLRRKPQRRSYASTSSRTPEIFDVVCVGGGPAGLSLLAALRANPITSTLKIALIESQSLTPTRTFSPSPDSFSNRCSSLTPSSVRFLSDIGAWKFVRGERVQGYGQMRVWDGVSGAAVHFDAFGGAEKEKRDEGGVVAYMNENVNLTAALLRRVEELGGVEILDGERVEDITLGREAEEGDLSQWPVVKLSGGRELAARLLVGADGANSPVRGFAGIESTGWDYGRVGLVATLCMEGEGEAEGRVKTAYQRFLPTGPVACLPLPGKFSTLVWSTTPELAAKLKSLSPRDFVGMVNAAFRLGVVDLKYLHTLEGGQEEEAAWREDHVGFDGSKIPQRVVGVQDGSIASFPLKLRHADTYIGERVALVGDAAHTTHPLAGQGLNAGQGDVESLARTIEYAVAHGMDIGVRMSLEQYMAERYVKNHVLLGVVDKLHKLYSVESGPLVGLRSLGLGAVDALEPVKAFFMRQAAGTGKIL